MFSTKYQDFRARVVIHAGQSHANWENATLPPIFQAAANLHPPAENLSDSFGSKTGDHIYMPFTNPTNKSFKHTSASLVTSSGMAAITNACMAVLRAEEKTVTGIHSYVESKS